MTRTVTLIHTYAALLTVVNLAVYAVTGGYAALHLQRSASTEVRFAEFQASAGETDRQTAGRVIALLGLTLATPIQTPAIQHTPSGELLLDFYHANGRHKVTVLRNQGQLRIEVTRNTWGRYAGVLHLTTGAFRSGDWRMQVWAYENEFALWCFLTMLASAVWMAVVRFRKLAATRMRLLHTVAGGAFFPFALLLGITALQMAHRTWFEPIQWAARAHRSSSFMAAMCAILIPILAATGIYLWWRTRPKRGVAIVVGVAAATLSLIVWMRL